MKTPDEIKKGLNKCSSDRSICSECEFSNGNAGKWQKLMRYALDLIHRLEAELAEVKRERDAAVETLCSFGTCDGCVRAVEPIISDICISCERCCKHSPNGKFDNWQWRGVCPDTEVQGDE